jgi:UDP:flavonoid glycosyltransferase YjiC (YdhE family)
LPLKMRAIAFWFKKTAAFQYDHTNHQKQKSGAPPINFFHSGNCVYFYDGESSQIAENQTKKFDPSYFSSLEVVVEAMKNILVAPLNWGLGHVARSIPLIQALENLGAKVLLASDGGALRLLKAEFPHLPSFELPSYRIRYEHSNMVRNIAWQLPRIMYAIRAEQWATERLVREHKIAGIISDNRYGCFSRQANSIMLTHQLHLHIPNDLLEWAANRVLRRALRRFDAVWVPDVGDEPNLSGKLSHNQPEAHPNIRFIGPLSRLYANTGDSEYDVAVVLSGPEPQRTYLEQRLLEQAMSLPHKFIFIQGKTKAKEHYYVADNVEVVSYLTSRDLNKVLLASSVLVCRSGYSSIMDLAALGKKALLIPTPGQTEQEYLADFFAQQNIFFVQKQEEIDLETGLVQLEGKAGFRAGQFQTNGFVPDLEHWLQSL